MTLDRPTRLAMALSLAVATVGRTAAAAPPVPPPLPPAEETASERAAKLRAQGNDAMIGMRYSDALASYRLVSQLVPDDVGVYYSIARAHQLLGEYAAALTALEQFEGRATPETKAKVGPLDALLAQIQPRVATLTLTCGVPGARVLVRDRVVGTTPLAPTRLEAGAATMQVELDGFFTESRNVVLPGGGSLAIEVVLQPKRTNGLLAVQTDPFGARILVDGHESGTTTPRIELTLPAGSHEVVAHHEGYDDARVPIFLPPGASRDLSIPMSKSVPVTSRWWFWTSVGVAIAGGAALAIAFTTDRGASQGSLPPGQVGVR